MKIAVIGLGTVGKGLLSVIDRKGEGILLTAVADSKSAIISNQGLSPKTVLEKKVKTGLCGEPGLTAKSVIDTADYDILVELSPTNADTAEPAVTYIRSALARGKHVVTSNKGPIALYYRELKELAHKNEVSLRYEATVAGAIPIIHTLCHGLKGNTIKSLYGVLNGTCNYILTRMASEGLTYLQALNEARELGYAEADPAYDVKGIDAAIKLVILANTIWDMGITLKDAKVTGIDLLTSDAVRLAEEQESTIRLIAEAVPEKGMIRVSPRIIPKSHPLVVDGSLNAITLCTDLAGEITMIGKGAGSIETASAVLGDILFIYEKKE